MMNPSEVQEQTGTNGTVAETQNVDRIRDILFGQQMRDYDGRFQRLEERLAVDANNLRSDLQKRFDALEAFTRSEMESLAHRLTNEQHERSQALERIGRDLAETARHFEERITNVGGQLAKEMHDLREQMLEHAKALTDEVKVQHDQLRAGLNQEVQQVRSATTGRDALAELFAELSRRLKNEFQLPGVP